MPRRVHKSKGPSGSHQRKVRKAREESFKEYEGLMLRFVKLSGKSQKPDNEAGIFDSDNTKEVFLVQPSPQACLYRAMKFSTKCLAMIT